MATAKRLPSGNWRVRVYYGSDNSGKKLVKSFTAPTKRECERKASDFLQFYAPVDGNSDMTVAEAIDWYIRSKDNVLSPSTIRSYRSIERHCFNDIKNVRVSEINSAIVQREINIESKTVSPKTIRNRYGLLYASVKYVCKDKTLTATLPQKIKPDIHIPTKDEVNALIDNAPDAELRLAIMLAAFMGLRLSEICGIDWKNINLTTGTIDIKQALVKSTDDYKLKTTKSTSSKRTLEIPSLILNELKQAPCKQGKLIPVLPTTLGARFYRFKCKMGVDCRFHDLRHYYASVMLLLGVPDKYAMERMGHATNYMLKNVYQHTFKEKQHSISAMLDDYFSTNS